MQPDNGNDLTIASRSALSTALRTLAMEQPCRSLPACGTEQRVLPAKVHARAHSNACALAHAHYPVRMDGPDSQSGSFGNGTFL